MVLKCLNHFISNQRIYIESELSNEKLLNFAAFGNVVPEGYNYHQKKITTGQPLNINGASLKWYELYPPETVISQKQVIETRVFLETEAKAGRLKLDCELGFAILLTII